MWVAIVEGRAISPDMLPIGRYSMQTGKGNRGGRHVSPEELPVSKVVTKTVWSSKEGLLGVKQADTAVGIGH